jgi:hypothetical protein
MAEPKRIEEELPTAELARDPYTTSTTNTLSNTLVLPEQRDQNCTDSHSASLLPFA